MAAAIKAGDWELSKDITQVIVTLDDDMIDAITAGDWELVAKLAMEKAS